jgi:ABC-2 type transport system permease protein
MTAATVSPAVSTPRRISATSTVARLAGTELRLIRRDLGALVGLVAFPAVTVLILAGVFGSTPDPDFGGVRPSEHYVVGYVGVVLASLGLVTLPSHIAAHREAGVQRRFRAAGVSAGTQVASHVAFGAALGVVASAIVLAVGAAIYGLPAPEDPLAAAGWFAAGLVCFIAIGCALGSLFGSSRAANAIGNLVFVPMFLLGGGGPPREVMTGPMQTLSDALPLSHLIGGLRLAWLGETDDPHALWWPVAVALLAVLLAGRNARRTVG